MTKTTAKHIRAFVDEARMFAHLLNCVPYDDELSLEERQDLLGLRPFSNAVLRLANRLRRQLRNHERKQKKTR